MKKLELVRLTPGRFDYPVLTDRNTKDLRLDDNGVVHATMLNDDRWMLFGIVDAVKLAPDEYSQEVKKQLGEQQKQGQQNQRK